MGGEVDRVHERRRAVAPEESFQIHPGELLLPGSDQQSRTATTDEPASTH